MRPAVMADRQVTTYYEAIDRYHLTERLAAILRALDLDAVTRADRLSRWNASLDVNDYAIYRIRQEIRTAHADALAHAIPRPPISSPRT